MLDRHKDIRAAVVFKKALKKPAVYAIFPVRLPVCADMYKVI